MRAGEMARRRRFIVALGILLIAVGGGRSARASGPQDEELRARKLYAAGDFQGALDIYTDLYGRNPHPTYMRNIGRCYQNLGEPDRAIRAFRDYLRTSKDLAPEARREVEGFIKEMEELKRSREPSPAASPGAPAESSAAGARAPAPAAPPSASSQVAARAPKLDAPTPPASVSNLSSEESPLTVKAAPSSADGGSILGRWWFWTAAAVVVGGVVAGILLASSASASPSKQSDLGPMRAQF
jgi:tetratricopeptide (TPR) repeat protein